MGAWQVLKMDKLHRRPPPRGGLAIVSVSTRIVIFGGADRSPTLYDDLWVLETAAERNEWSKVIPTSASRQKLVGRSGATMTAVGNSVFMFGGQDPSSGACTDELVQLNASNWNWSVVQVDGGRPPPRHSHSTVLWRAHCLLVFGGAGHQGPLNDLWIFNTLSRQWTAVESQGLPPMPREMHSGTMADDSKMIVFGGRGSEQQVLSDVSLFDADSMTWQQHQETEYPRCAHTAVAMQQDVPNPTPMQLHELSLRQTEHIAIYGGFDGSSVRGDLLEIDPDTLRVRLLCKDPEPTASSEQLPEPRFAHGAATLPSSTQPFGKVEAELQEMAVFGGVNPASDLNTVAIWRTA